MKFSLLHILHNFAVVDDRLVRKLATGHARSVTLVERGRLVSMLAGVKYYGPEVAYACIHRVVPMFPVVQVDGDPLNMAESNLMPCRLRRLRFRLVEVPGGYRHPLARVVFRLAQLCHKDWVRLARLHYLADLAYVRQLESVQGVAEAVPVRPVVARRDYAPSVHAAGRPEGVAGRTWHWWCGKWVSLPEACHSSDDWMVRAEVVAKYPGARFVYDSVAQRTISVI